MIEAGESEVIDTEYKTLTPDTPINQYVALFYGASGTQKTRTAAQWPDPLFLSCERGEHGGLIAAREFHPKQIRVESYPQLITLLPQLQRDGGTKFKTIVLDSITYFQKLTMAQVLVSSGREIAQIADWGLSSERLRTIINTLSNIKAHFIIIATEQMVRDEISGKIMGLPNVPGKLAHELPAGVDLCLRFHTRGSLDNEGKSTTKFYIQSAGDDTWVAKDCSGLLPNSMMTEEDGLTGIHFKPLFLGGSKT